MAEGGYDPDETNPFDPNEGADETTSLIPRHRGDEIEMTDRTSTPFSSTSKHRTQETSFMSETPCGKIITREEERKDEAVLTIKEVFPNAKSSEFITRISDYGQIEVRLTRQGGKWRAILDRDGYPIKDAMKKLSKTLRDALGDTVMEIRAKEIEVNNSMNKIAEERIKELDEQIANAVGEEHKRLMEEREIEQEGINERNQENEAIEERLSLRQRIKEIFKKYGFTAIAVSTAIATVIGVIVSNLKAGLTKVAKGVGNGLKELGKKLGEILPGMIGAIASFIFRTAGEVIGFFAKNAWLLIVGLVVFAVEQFKNKKK